MKPKVVVANVFKQHSHQLAFALQNNNMLHCYFTGVWYKPDAFIFTLIRLFPPFVKNKLYSYLKKRYYEKLNLSLIKQIVYPELIYRYILFWDRNDYLLNVNKCFDRIVRKKLLGMDFDIFIGYEMGSKECFSYCKRNNKICILDLAMVAYNYQLEYAKRFNDINLSKRIEGEILQKEKEIELADYFFVPSNIVKDSLLELNISDEKILMIPYGSNLSLFEPKQVYPIHNKLRILFVGALENRKGIGVLLESIKQLNSSEIELNLVGNITDAKETIKKYKGVAKLWGFVHHDVLGKLYKDCDIFIMPSYLEGFSQVVIEAMASGLPVIVTNMTGFKGIVKDGYNGFVISAGNVAQLKEKIIFFLHNKNCIEEMGRNASQSVKEYSWEHYRKNVVENIMKIWDESNKSIK